MNVTGRIIFDINPFITNYDKSSKQKINGLKRIQSRINSMQGVKCSLSQKDIKPFKKLNNQMGAIAGKIVKETANYARGEVYRRAYIAPEPYIRHGVIYQPRTLAERSYSYLIPKAECPKNVYISKVSFYNNAETGWFGEVAVLWEYGSRNTPAHPMMRPAMELSKTVFNNSIKWHVSRELKKLK